MSKSHERVKGIIKRFLEGDLSRGDKHLTITSNIFLQIGLDIEGNRYLSVVLFGSQIALLALREQCGERHLDLELSTKGFNTITTTNYLHAIFSSIPTPQPVAVNLLKKQAVISLESFKKIPFETVFISYIHHQTTKSYHPYQIRKDGQLLRDETRINRIDYDL